MTLWHVVEWLILLSILVTVGGVLLQIVVAAFFSVVAIIIGAVVALVAWIKEAFND